MDSKKILFNHIPKTGGFSINQAFRYHFGFSALHHHLEDDPRKECRYILSSHHQLRYHRDNLPGYDDMFKFTFVRNPFDRFISALSYLWYTNPESDPYYETNIEKRQRLINEYGDIHNFIMNCKDYSQFEPLFVPMYKYICMSETDPSHDMDFIGRFENMQNDWERLCEMIGCPGLELNHYNRTSKKYEMSQEERDCVWKYYERDFKMFYPELYQPGTFMEFINDPKRCKTLVINLDDCKDRYEHFVREANKAGLYRFERFPALDGNDIDKSKCPYPPDRRPNQRAPTNYQDMSRGQVACALSHLKIMEQCIEDRIPRFVFEDDAIFCDGFAGLSNLYWSQSDFGKKNHLIMVGHNKYGDGLVQTPTWNMHAYLYDAEFCQAFIDHVKQRGLFCIDINLIEFQKRYDKYCVWLHTPSTNDRQDRHRGRDGGLVYQTNSFRTEIGRGGGYKKPLNS